MSTTYVITPVDGTVQAIGGSENPEAHCSN